MRLPAWLMAPVEIYAYIIQTRNIYELIKKINQKLKCYYALQLRERYSNRGLVGLASPTASYVDIPPTATDRLTFWLLNIKKKKNPF